MPIPPLSDHQRRTALQLTVFVMAMLLATINGGRYFSVSPTVLLLAVFASVFTWIGTRYGGKAIQVKVRNQTQPARRTEQ